MANKIGKKIMLALVTASFGFSLGGCKIQEDHEKQQARIEEVKRMFEYEASYNMDLDKNSTNRLFLQTEIIDGKYLLKFQFKQYLSGGRSGGIYSKQYDVYYEVDKETYFDFRNNFSSDTKQNEVDMITTLVEKYDPIKIDSHIKGEQDYISEDLTF